MSPRQKPDPPKRKKCLRRGCRDRVAEPTDRIPGTNRYGSVAWCVEHEAERIRKITAAFDNLCRDP